jgi:hypothetical protein
MRINVHIERLILEHLPIRSFQGPHVQRAIEEELTRLLAADGLSDELRGDVAVPRVRAGSIRFTKETQPTKLGQNIGRAIHESIGDSNKQKATNIHLPIAGGIPQ